MRRRFELTEALSEAKEQLLTYQRHGSLTPGGSRPTSVKGTLSRESTAITGGLSNKGGSPNGIKKPQSPSGQKFASNNINLGFDSSNVQSQGKPLQGRAKQGSMSDSRQRIAAAIGRK